jgi:translation elongation factor EF-Ts
VPADRSTESGNLTELLDQQFLKDPEKSVGEHMSQACTHLKEIVAIVRFMRWEAQTFRKDDEFAPFQKKF